MFFVSFVSFILRGGRSPTPRDIRLRGRFCLFVSLFFFQLKVKEKFDFRFFKNDLFLKHEKTSKFIFLRGGGIVPPIDAYLSFYFFWGGTWPSEH